MKFLLVFLSLLVLVYAHNKYDGDIELYSSSIVGLMKLWELEKQFMLHVKGYADALQEKLETLKSHMKVLDRPSYKTKAERENYVSNPLNAFGLIRRLREDWVRLQVYTKDKPGKAELEAMKQLLLQKPTYHDMKEALKGFSRIEQTYELNPVDISEGRLLHQQFNKKLSLRDCLALAKHNYESGQYTSAALWYRQAISRREEPNHEIYSNALGKTIPKIRTKYAAACLMHALHIRSPTLSHKELEEEVETMLSETSSIDVEKYVRQLLEMDVDKFIRQADKVKPAKSQHDLGCQGHFVKRTDLSCRYNFTTTPFLRLAPLKMEEINRDPYIVMYHNVISDKEIEEMKRLVVGHMSNGFSGTFSENQTEPVEIVARLSWLVERNAFMDRINHRITDMTGFDVSDFPALQVANFGLGNFFRAHYDFMFGNRVAKETVELLGDRLGSLIFYAGDVSQGGMTVFPKINVSVTPQKGNSLFWYNLLDDGTPDYRTLHSVCPVIVGSRWTLTKWLHMAAQVFIKPCTFQHKSEL